MQYPGISMTADKMFEKKRADLHVDLILDWLHRATVEKDRKKSEDTSPLSWGTIQQLNKTTYLLGIFQVVLIILFATVAGSEVGILSCAIIGVITTDDEITLS